MVAVGVAKPFPALKWLLAVALIGVVAVRLVAGIRTIDDAFITFRYSQHIAASQGFTFNPPQHVLGTSTPLFTLLIAAAARLGLDLQVSSFVISLVADVVSCALVASILLRLGYPLAALLSVIALAMAPSVVVFSVSGMETSLYVALVIAASWGVQRERWMTAAWAAGAAWLCRPDGILVVAVVCAAALWSLPRRRAALVCVAAAALMVPWVIFATWYFGSPVPTSILAKADVARSALAGFRVAKGFFLTARDLLVSILSIAGAVVLWRTRALGARAWVAWGALYTLVFAASRAFDGYMWYFTPLMPLYYAAVAVATETLIGRLSLASSEPRRRLMTAAGPVVAVLVFVAIGVVAIRDGMAEMAHSQANREDLYQAIAGNLAAADGRCAIAAQEIGALGFYYPGPIVDLVGITTPEAIGRPRGEVLRESTACWLVNYDNNLFVLDQGIFGSDWFQREFTLIDRTVVSPTRALVTYRRRAAGAVR